MPLTKRQFLDKYIVRPLGHVRSPQQHLERRASKIEVEIERLPNAMRKTWQDKVAAQRAAATASDKSAAIAYHALKQVKLDIRAAADKFEADWPATKIHEQAAKFKADATLFAQQRDQMTRRLDAVIRDVDSQSPISGLDVDDAIPVMADLRERERTWRAELIVAETDRGSAISTLCSIENYLETFLFVFFRAGRTANVDVVDATKDVHAALDSLKVKPAEKLPTMETIKEMFVARVREFNSKLQALLDTSTQQKRDPEKSKEDRLVESEADRRLLRAGQAMLNERVRDEVALARKDEKKPAPAPQIRCDMKPAFRQLHTLSGAARDIDSVKAEATTAAMTLVKGLKAGSDELFDLLLKSPQDLQSEIKAHLGLGDPLTEIDRQRIEAAAVAIVEAVRANAPDTMKDAGASMVFGGKQYKKIAPLGAGGNGTVELFEAADGARVAVKSIRADLKDNDDAPNFVQELRAHRQATGPDGQRNPNVLGLQGVCVDTDGTVHAVLEYAPGGDVQDLGESLLAATDAGLIPEAARQALVQHALAQAVEGLDQVHASNLAHFDIKERNYLLGVDGKVKICDFGTAVSGDADGKINTTPSAVTALYGAPEIADNTADGKSDTYSLGVMLANLSGPAMNADVAGPSRRNPVDQPVTALDRLRNAMLDPDPAKRPSLEAIKKSAYLDSKDYLRENVEALFTKITAYAAAFAKTKARVVVNVAMDAETRKYLQRKIEVAIDADMSLKAMQRDLLTWRAVLQRIAHEIASGVATEPTRRQDLEKASATLQKMIDSLQAQCEAAQNTDALKALKAELQELSAPFGPARARKPQHDGRTSYPGEVQAATEPTLGELSKLLA